MFKRLWMCSLCLLLMMALVGCGPKKEEVGANAGGEVPKDVVEPQKEAVLRVASQYAPESLDPHKDYRGWHTNTYGITETLFCVQDDFSLEPLLAESGTAEGLVWTITLNEKAKFSNGDTVTADMVVRNLKRLASENKRFEYLGTFDYKATNEKTFTITTEAPYPTMLNALASCETAIIHLDKTTDFDQNIIATGPFVVESFVKDTSTSLVKNSNYWKGDVALDQVTFFKMPDEDALLMAMQNGEIDCYQGGNAAAMEIFRKSPETYEVVTVPATRLQLYFLNQERLSTPVRQAIQLIVDAKEVVAFLGGTVSETQGPFSEKSAYGKVTKPAVNPEEAAKILEAEGYEKNSEGYYEKEGKVLEVNIAYYPARSLDVLATLMQEQLQRNGIKVLLTSEEKPDSTYITTRDFDIALYSMNADLSGDPEYFISNTLKQGAFYNVGGFNNEECEKQINLLSAEMDPAKRASLANQIIQSAIDDYAHGYVAIFNKVTVLRKGVSGFAENSPFDFFGVSAQTKVQ